jgi:hypothetical protein
MAKPDSATACPSPLGHAGVGLVKRAALLATTGRDARRWHGGPLEVAQAAGRPRRLGAGGHEAQGRPADPNGTRQKRCRHRGSP